MAIDKEYQNCIAVLTAALFRREQRYDITPRLFEIAKKHSIMPMICGELLRSKKIDKATKQICREYVLSSMLNNERLIRIQNDLVGLLVEYGIPYAVLKGCSVAMLYPEPDMRPLGDIDILIDAGKKTAVDQLMIENGYRYEHEQAHHICYEKDGAHIEIHGSLSIFFGKRREPYVMKASKEAVDHTIEVNIEKGHIRFRMLELKYQLLSLLTHMERHMQDEGIGLRQLCDWAVTVDRNRQRVTSEDVLFLNNCGLTRFAAVITKVCERYLGLDAFDWGIPVEDDVVEMMIEEICDSGNIKNISIERSLSHYWASGANRTGSSRISLMGLYYKNIMRKALDKHPLLEKMPFAFPVFSIIYPARWWIRSLLGKREKVNLRHVILMGKKRKQLYDRLRLYE